MILEKLKHAATILETNRLANTALVELDRSLRPPDADVAYEIQKCLESKNLAEVIWVAELAIKSVAPHLFFKSI